MKNSKTKKLCKSLLATPHFKAAQRRSFAILILFSLITFSSCYTSRKMDKWINTKYEGSTSAKIKSNDYITIKTDNIPTSDLLSKTQKGKRKFIPAVFYYHWDFTTTSTLNPYIPITNLSAAIVPYANSKGLRQKLNGQKIELAIQKVPTIFSLKDQGTMLYLIFGYTGWQQIYIEPQVQDVVVSYRLLKEGVELKKGEIIIPNHDQPVGLKMFQSPKKMTFKYFDQYNNNIKSMSKELVDRLMMEL